MQYALFQPKEKPLISAVQRKKRLAWAKNRQNWVQRQWDSVIWSDESRFQLSVGEEGQRVIREKSEAFHRDCLKRTVKFPASLMVWGCMSARGVGSLHFINGTVNAVKYQSILEEHLSLSIPELQNSFGEFIFQQDGASCHTAKSTKQWFSDKQIPVLEWPACSPDLSPIESVWGKMKSTLKADPAKTMPELKSRLQSIWNKITPDECQTLVNTMNRRIKAVIKRKGDTTQW